MQKAKWGKLYAYLDGMRALSTAAVADLPKHLEIRVAEELDALHKQVNRTIGSVLDASKRDEQSED